MRVNTDELIRQADELRSVANRLNDIQDSVLRITRNLSQETVGEKFQPKLLAAARAIGSRGDELRKMRTALDQIAQLYDRCETTIVDEADHAAVHHEHFIIERVRIPEEAHPWVIPIPDTTPPDIPDWRLPLEQVLQDSGSIDWVPFDG